MFYDKTMFDDGLTVLSETIEQVRSVAIGIWFAVGSRDEGPEEAGMSHFLEHMMFKGTPTRSAAQISETFDRLGAELNAFTSKEYTCYYARVLDEHVETAVEVLADMAGRSLLADEACASEREVVLEEIARLEDTPDDRIHELFATTMWPAHPLGLPVLGRRETVGAFGNAASSEYRTKHYSTGNAVVAAAGNLEHADLVALVKEHLALPAAARSERSAVHAADEPSLAVLEKDTEQTHIVYGVPGLNAGHEDRFVLSVLDTILGGGMSSRLFQEIREKRGLAYAVYSYHALYEETGQFAVYAGTRPGNAEQVVAHHPERDRQGPRLGRDRRRAGPRARVDQGPPGPRPGIHSQPHDPPRQGRGDARGDTLHGRAGGARGGGLAGGCHPPGARAVRARSRARDDRAARGRRPVTPARLIRGRGRGAC